MLTPREIETKEFTRTRVSGGYKTEEVDSFLDEILMDYSAVLEERDALNKKIGALNEKLDQFRSEQDNWKNAILNTQKSYDEIVKSANKKADKLVFDAEDYAKKLIEKAKAEADLQKEIKVKLASEVDNFKNTLISAYTEHIKLVRSISELKQDDEPLTSDTLEMLKTATDKISSTPVEVKGESPTVVMDSIKSLDNSGLLFEKNIVAAKDDNDDNGLSSANDEDEDLDELPTKTVFGKRSSKNAVKDDIADEDLNDDEYANDKKLKGLFEENEEEDKKPAKRKLFGNGKKKKKSRLFFNDDDDDDDDDDEYYDDDDDE